MQEQTMSLLSEIQPALELGMQELEEMEAPSFWSGFKQGLVIGAIAVAGATLAT
jgi:hypothetical protein